MRLMYLWVDDGGQFKEFACNFSSSYVFALDKRDSGWNFCVAKSACALPTGFFDIGRHRHVSDVSVIVGANAAGKTSIARFLREIRSNENAITEGFRYVIVYEVEGVWHVQWWLGTDESMGKNEDVVRIGVWPEKTGSVIECCAGSDCKKNNALWDFEFAYYSPHFTTENPFLANNPEMENLSTWGIMYGGFEEQMGRPYGYEDHRGIQRNYIAVERRMGLTALLHIPKSPDGVDLPKPKNVRISIHRVELLENMSWLGAQQRKLSNILGDEVHNHNGMPDWTRGKLKDISDLQEICDYALGKIVTKNKCFVLQAFAAFILSRVRISGFFERSYDPLYVFYAERLKSIYQTVVKPKIDSSDKIDIKEVSRCLLQELNDAVRLYKVPQPGAIAEEDYPEVLRMRECVARVFAKLVEWSRLAENAEKDQHGVLDDILVRVEASDELGAFYRDYEMSMDRADFLSFGYEPVLAAGQMCLLSMFGRLYDYLCRNEVSRQFKMQAIKQNRVRDLPVRFSRRSFSDSVLVFLDEAETAFHPQRQREVVKDVLRFYNWFDGELSVHLIFSTHSPILLSDVPSCNVIRLKCDADEEGVMRSTVQPGGATNTFAANIFDLYKDSFFLEKGTMGAFAAGKVNKLLHKLNPPREEGWSDKEYQRALMDVKIDDDDLKIAKLIGDPFLSHYVWRRLDELSKTLDEPEDELSLPSDEARG